MDWLGCVGVDGLVGRYGRAEAAGHQDILCVSLTDCPLTNRHLPKYSLELETASSPYISLDRL